MIMSGMQPRYARSYAPWWVGPSLPTRPARSRMKRTGSFWIAQSCTTWSYLVVGGRRRGRWVGRSVRREAAAAACAPALEEGRVDGAERLDALDGEAGGEGHRVLLRNPDVIRPLGEAFAEAVDAGAARHRRGDRHHRAVVGGDVDERVGEDGGVRRRALGRARLGGGKAGGGERRGEVGRRRPWGLVGGGLGRGGGARARALLPSSRRRSRGTPPWALVGGLLGGRQAVIATTERSLAAISKTEVVEPFFVGGGGEGGGHVEEDRSPSGCRRGRGCSRGWAPGCPCRGRRRGRCSKTRAPRRACRPTPCRARNVDARVHLHEGEEEGAG